MAKTPEASGKRTINLALQGGGAHGAFTWGVLDRLLEDERLAIEGISGTSAGAINAAVLSQGHLKGGAAGARVELDLFWHRLSEIGWISPVHRGWYERAMGSWNIDDSPRQTIRRTVESFAALNSAGASSGIIAASQEKISIRCPGFVPYGSDVDTAKTNLPVPSMVALENSSEGKSPTSRTTCAPASDPRHANASRPAPARAAYRNAQERLMPTSDRRRDLALGIPSLMRGSTSGFRLLQSQTAAVGEFFRKRRRSFLSTPSTWVHGFHAGAWSLRGARYSGNSPFIPSTSASSGTASTRSARGKRFAPG